MPRRWLHIALALLLATSQTAPAAEKLPDLTGPQAVMTPPTQADMNTLRRAINQNFLLNDGTNPDQPGFVNAIMANRYAATYYAPAYKGLVTGQFCPFDGSSTVDASHGDEDCINAAIAAAAGAGGLGSGGKVALPQSKIGLLGSVNMKAHVALEGPVIGAGFQACATQFIWLGNGAVGVSGGTMIAVQDSSATAVMAGMRIANFCLYNNGSTKPDSAMAIYAGAGGVIENINIIDPGVQGIYLNSQNIANIATSQITFRRITIGSSPGSTAEGVVFDYCPAGISCDVFETKWYDTTINMANGTAVDCRGADGNDFFGLWVRSGATEPGIRLRGSDVSGVHGCHGNTFHGVASGAAFVGGVQADAGSYENAYNNWIFGLKRDDGEPEPIDNTPGGGVFFCDNNGYCNTPLSIRDLTVTLNQTTGVSNRLYTTTGAGGTGLVNLPAATILKGVAGQRNCYIATDQQLIVRPNTNPGTDTISLLGFTGSAGTAGFLTLHTGASVCITVKSTGTFLASNLSGVWEFVTPTGTLTGNGSTVYNFTTSNPANPVGTTDLTGVMMGLGVTFTPLTTGFIELHFGGDLSNTTATNGAFVALRWGTGTPPANGDAVTGTQCGNTRKKQAVSSNNDTAPFEISCTINGVVVGTPIWIDADVAAVTAGTGSIGLLSLVRKEF